MRSLLIITIIFAASHLFSQEYFTQSKSELIKLKAESVKKEEFLKASKISAEINFRDSLSNKIQQDKKAKGLAVKNENFKKAETLKKEILKNESYDILRKELKIALSKENYSKAEEVKSQLMKLRYSKPPVKEEHFPNKPKNHTSKSLVNTKSSILIVNSTRYILDILIDSNWVFSLAPKDSGSVQNVVVGSHKMEITIAGLNTMKRISYDFTYDGSPMLIEMPFQNSKLIIKTRKDAAKGKSIADKEKYYHPKFDNSLAEIPQTAINFDIENPVYKDRELNKPIYNYQNIYFDIPHYFSELPESATGKIKFNIGIEFINNLKSFNGLFWGIGYSFYLTGYTMNSQYLNGGYVNGYDATYYTNAQLPFSMYLLNITGSFGYLYEPSEYIGLYSSFRVIPSFSYISNSTLQSYTNQTTYGAEFGANIKEESDFNVNFGASLNAGAMFYPFGKLSTYGISTEAVLYLGSGVNIGFNLGMSYRFMANKDLRYRYYQ